MKYQIDWLEKKTSTAGNPYIRASLTSTEGEKITDVAIFGSFPRFAELAPGSEVEGELTAKEYNGKQSYTLNEVREKKAPTGIKAAQERKGEMIKEAQERKNESIAFFNATNSAISLISNNLGNNPSMSLQENINYWREWFLSEWQKYEAQDITSKHTPFQ